jgi:hypothetical protein
VENYQRPALVYVLGKELLRWGTLEPFVAFALSQGIARSRDDAAKRKAQFNEWIERQPNVAAEGEELIDPRNFLKWSPSRPLPSPHTRSPNSRCRLSETGRNSVDMRSSRFARMADFDGLIQLVTSLRRHRKAGHAGT